MRAGQNEKYSLRRRSHDLRINNEWTYFDGSTIEKIINLPLVKRHLSAHDYFQCKDGGSPAKRIGEMRPKSVGPVNAILSFGITKIAYRRNFAIHRC